MEQYINTLLSSKNIYRKSFLLISLLFLFITNGYSQTNLPKKAKLKTITYSDYAISGCVYKKQFVEGQELTFIARSSSYNTYPYDTIISGRYFYDDDGNSYIDGIRTNRGHDVNIITEGIFKVTNTNNKIGITTNKKEGQKLEILGKELTYYQIDRYDYSNEENITLILQKLTDNKFSLKIKYESLILETIIPYSIDPEVSYDFNKYILDSNIVKLSFNNGDVFTGIVKSRSGLPAYCDYDAPYAPENGEYRYVSGEVSTGVFECNSYFERFYLEEGVTVFADGSIGNGDWLYDQNLTDSEQERIYSKDRTPTEMRNMAKSINEEKDIKLRAKKTAREQVEKEKLRQQQFRRNKLVEKYGEYWGNLISKQEFTLDMTKEMVLEFTSDKYYRISKATYGNVLVETWVFDKQKMSLEILKEKGEEGAEVLTGLYLMESFGFNLASEVPTLKFTNGKLTGIYQY